VGFAFTVLYFWLAKPTVASLIAGSVVAIPGLIVRALASGHVKKNEELTTSGPYACTRNPLYLGSLILAAGFAWAAQSWWIALALTAFFVAIYVPVIRAEESFLRERFPQFADYSQRVPRLLPRFTRGKSPGSFSWDLYRKHREYNAPLGAFAVMAALAAKLIWAG
jgi:protein-S-isoprenylcysteine O-methyltransferase Ste14